MPYRDIGKIIEKKIKDGEMKESIPYLQSNKNTELVLFKHGASWCYAAGYNVVSNEEIIAVAFAKDIVKESRCYA